MFWLFNTEDDDEREDDTSAIYYDIKCHRNKVVTLDNNKASNTRHNK
jgi:hypothetical protein